MRLHRFYTNQQIGTQKELTIDSADFFHQIRNVFRLKVGDAFIVFDGSGSDYMSKITSFGKHFVVFDIEFAERSKFMPQRDVILYASIIKKDNFEWIVEKATELGVTKIVPVISERSEKKALNMERLKKIAVEASEQSGRGNIPEIGEIVNLEQSVEDSLLMHPKNVMAFHTESDNFAKNKMKDISKDQSVAIFIGPEGGYSLDEVDLFTKNGIDIVTLGDQVLRAETAVIAALSLVIL